VLPSDIAKLLPKNRLLSEVCMLWGCTSNACQGHALSCSAAPRMEGMQARRCAVTPQTEWRNLGVQQSRGWVHYAIHKPEPHIMLYR
jgi:Cyclin-dependent kinase regulatory subunit